MEVFAWPLAVTVIAVSAMLLFWKPIARFLDRAKKIGMTGIEAAGAGAQDTSKSEVGPSVADEFARLFDNQLLIQREDSIRTDLVRIVAGADQAQKEKILLRIIAALTLAQQFDTTYRTIWGSQLNALEIANATRGGVQLVVVKTLYNQAEAQHKEWYANYSFEQWLQYMEIQLLIIKKDDKISITTTGIEFLKYIIHQGYALSKGG